MHVLIAYYSQTGNTERLGGAIAVGVRSVDGVDYLIAPAKELSIEDVLAADGLIVGSPTHYGTMAAEMKALLGGIGAEHRSRTQGMIGAAFATAGHAGGRERTLLAILKAMLAAGFIVVGSPTATGCRYGIGAVSPPVERELESASLHGVRVALLVKSLSGHEGRRDSTVESQDDRPKDQRR